LKPRDSVNGKWEEYPIGSGTGDWPHGSPITYILPGGKPALIVTYHGAYNHPYFPEIFEIPNDPKDYPWAFEKMLNRKHLEYEFIVW